MNRLAGKLTWGWYLLIVPTAAVLPIALVQLMSGRVLRFEYYFYSIAYGLIYSCCCAGVFGIVMPIAAPVVLRSERWWSWVLLTIGVVLLGWLGGTIGYGLIWLANWPLEVSRTNYWVSMRICILMSLLFGLGGSVISYYRSKVEAVRSQIQQKELERERAMKLATESRLAALESRIHPHFLFNALNSISALIREDQGKAEMLTQRLASLLRASLDANEHLAPIERELAIVEDYLNIESVRFGERLQWKVERPAQVHGEVPPLSLQTMVENTLKHVVAKRRGPTQLLVRIERAGERWHLDVEDDGPGFDESAIESGHGLDNLRSRLMMLYAGDAWLRMERLPDGMRVRMIVPARAAA
jgi:sensor histidine kinase YesM